MRAATRVNAEQASKRTMCRPTRQRYRGRLIRLGEMSDDAQPLHRGSGGSMYTRKAHATRETQRQLREEITDRIKVENAKFVIYAGGAPEEAIKTVVAECPSGALK